ncbi:MAG TPA: peptide-methionine (S)-S-oxide reductase MsrA [Bryobacteraceae bacterium]|jgi:peptide-methionine (S)-S-oxide reductase|nr:peptide-methionine (S)-S-oxide reductase MsrA [Bryobacteraceae bacterium]
MRNRILLLSAVLATAGFTVAQAASLNFPEPPKASAPTAGTATAVLAGGCYWGMQGIFEHMKGVTNTVVGFAGGKKDTARYEIVEDGTTGHAESIKITYDPAKITYGDLLKVYFSVAHDPTTLNRQHYDVGTQYRSAIFYVNDEQKNVAEAYIKELNGARVFKNPIVTQLLPLQSFPFYSTDLQDHQHFLDRYPTQGYIAAMDIPLLNKFKATYPEFYTKEIK